ncbi:MAG: helix-turn-helix domain-containing protein [Candidatus Doudnabacteria bacterium]|nr:helix-turn-helix domain-containing protein [Candidatus Doudnabacteria bacterium]
MPQNQIPELLTLKEACELLRVHANTLRNWEKEGKLQTIRIGTRRDRRFTKASLEQFFQTSNQAIAA